MAIQKSGKLGEKYIEILKFLKDRPEGTRADTLMKFLNLPSRTLYNRLSTLKELKLVDNIFPIWRVCHNQSSYHKVAKLIESSKKHIQGHKFSFTLKMIDKPDWWERRTNRLIKLKEYHFKKVDWGNNPYRMLISDDFKIQLFKNSIVFVNRKNYWGDDPYDAFLDALEDTLELLRYLEEKVKFKFFKHEIPQFSVRSQHIVKLKDSVAKRCKKEGLGYEVSINGERRVWVDLSVPFGREAGNKDYAPEDIKRLQDRDKDVLVNAPALPSKVDERLSLLTQATEGLVQTQQGFDRNIKTHFEVLKGIKEAIQELKDEVKRK